MDTRVLIAGAGPTGLTLGVELARRGIDFRIIDAATSAFAGSRGDGLQPRTLEVFDDLGVLDEVLGSGAPPFPIRAHVGGRYVGERRMVELTEPTPDVPHPHPWVLPQWRTEEILRNRLAELGGHVERGVELLDLQQVPGGVTARLSTGTARAAFLVGADGGRSAVRKALGVDFVGETDESIRMLLGDVQVTGLDHSCGHWFGSAEDPARGIALTPLPGTDSFQCAAPLPDGVETATLATLQAQLDEFSGRTDLRMHDLTWSTVWRPNIRMARRFRQGRVFLAGDAAHVHPPTGGQGLNTGIQDAYNLGWKLADGSADLLDSYELERLPVAASVLGLSAELLQRHVEGHAEAHRRGPETHQLTISYRNSPLSRDERTTPGRVRAGDRAPDSPLRDASGKQIRLFDLFRGTHWTHLAFDAEPPATSSNVQAHRISPTGTSLVDPDATARDIYDVSPGTHVLIRPDGHIARITR
ncbi:2-polyprenyl-6-methoxyphenol hydroxylase [Saccharopolyspora kobensis]|uniref:2-polyprenyl-6-methoxyphenol hydroxylase n=1 Tax=Saccharopolyspora kobensis TaxID=146035 RepID=A0A1H6BKV6_9PSEU|nr:FAD-dependent monooxygenase [Saccharopolyspora kobensis]SEG61262.1 2-polyprenyl-6-methoxyphenol hydroxylase [Saccharopolyspora kobensis]SFE87021.1 2-polyprenyl-6-methoxyphenol hydroxylase [Saccharopolyspora kobensis]